PRASPLSLHDALPISEGADVLSCGMPITTTAGHCHWLGLIADGEETAVRAAGRMLDADADFLKVMATGGNMTPSSDPFRPQYDRSEEHTSELQSPDQL